MSALGEMVTSVMLAAGTAGRRDDWRATAAPAANAAAASAAAAAGRHGERPMKDLMIGLALQRREYRRSPPDSHSQAWQLWARRQEPARLRQRPEAACAPVCAASTAVKRACSAARGSAGSKRTSAAANAPAETNRRGIELPGGARGHEHQPPWHPCRSVAANLAYQQCQKPAELRHARFEAWRQVHFPGAVEPDVLRSERHVRRLDRVDRLLGGTTARRAQPRDPR